MNATTCRRFVADRLRRATMVGLLLATPAFAAEPDHATVSLPADNVQFLPFYVAQTEDLFGAQGLAVKLVYLAGVGTTNGVISGAVEFGFSNGASLTRAAAHGQRLLAIALMSDRPTWAIEMRPEEAAASGFDPAAPLAVRARALAGKRFAVDSVQSVAHAYLRVVAEAGGIDRDSITMTPLVATEAIAAFERKAIDGVVTSPPWKQLLEAKYGAVPIADSFRGDPAWLTPFAAGLVIARPQTCAERRVVCEKMGRALLAASHFVRDRPQDALAILKHHFAALDPAVLERAFEVVRQSASATLVVSEAAVANSDRLNEAAGFIKKADQLTSYDGLYTDQFVR